MNACNSTQSFLCVNDGQCNREAASGFCEDNGFCSFDDEECQSGRRFGELSGTFSHECVPMHGVEESTSLEDGQQVASTGASSGSCAEQLCAVPGATTDEPTTDEPNESEGQGSSSTGEPGATTDSSAVCGDGRIDDGEACDSTEAVGSCADLGFLAGAITCSDACAFDLNGCQFDTHSEYYRERFLTNSLPSEFFSNTGPGWRASNDNAAEGNYAAASIFIGNNEQTDMLLTLTFSQSGGGIGFRLSTLSESEDALVFEVDGLEVGRWSGQTAWRRVVYAVSPGPHSFRWLYIRGDSGYHGSDNGAWVDDIQTAGGSL